MRNPPELAPVERTTSDDGCQLVYSPPDLVKGMEQVRAWRSGGGAQVNLPGDHKVQASMWYTARTTILEVCLNSRAQLGASEEYH